MKENIQIFRLKVVHATVHEFFGFPDIFGVRPINLRS